MINILLIVGFSGVIVLIGLNYFYMARQEAEMLDRLNWLNEMRLRDKRDRKRELKKLYKVQEDFVGMCTQGFKDNKRTIKILREDCESAYESSKLAIKEKPNFMKFMEQFTTLQRELKYLEEKIEMYNKSSAKNKKKNKNS